MGDSWDRPGQQLPLAEHLGHLGPQARRDASSRPGAGWPVRISRDSHHTRRPATASAATVNSNPRTSRTVTDPPPHEDANFTDE